jgi:hypothetical protein
MKRILTIGGGVAVLFAGVVALFVGSIFALTRPVVDASEQFLSLIGQGRVGEAYASTADGFKARQDEASFAADVARLGLADYATVAWYSRQIENGDGSAEGTVTTKAGEARRVAVRLVRQDGRWAVAGIRYGGEDLTSMNVPPAGPPGAR